MRYERQEIISQIGSNGQNILASAKIAIIGAGGLGSPVLTYLALAGVGNISIVDCDEVGLSNLNRQFIHGVNDIGERKVMSAQNFISSVNPEVSITPIFDKLDFSNAAQILAGFDVVALCVDNLEARIAANNACISLGIPLVDGGINGFYGYVTCINKNSPCLLCMGLDKAAINAPIPAIGVTAGIIGSLQANECLKIILNIGEPLFGRLLNYDGLCSSFDIIDIPINPACAIHGK